MKNIWKAFLVLLIALFCFPLASCKEQKNVKVLKEILLTEEDYAFAIAKNNDDLKREVNEMIAEMQADGSLEKLVNSYFDDTATFTYVNKTENALETDFVMATNAFFKPFEYMVGNAFKGVDVEFAYLIAQRLGKNLFIDNMEFDAIIPTVIGKENYIGMAGMTVNEERLKTVDFSTSYYTSAQVLTVLADDTTFDECETAEDVEEILKSKGSSYIIGTQTGTTGYYYSTGGNDFGYSGFPVTTNSYTTGALAFADLRNERINAVILDLQPSLSIARGFSGTKTQIFYRQFITLGGYKTFLTGLQNTLTIAVVGLIIGFVIGCLIATVKLLPSKNPIVKGGKWLCDFYVALFRGTPMVVQLLLMHFALFPTMGIRISSVMEAVLIFGMNSGAYMAEILRGGINAVDKGQMEAGRSLGFGFWQTMFRIVLPQAIKNILPTLGNEFIALIKETSVVSFIAVVDITKAFQNIGNATYEFFVPYIALAVVYLVLVFAISRLVKFMERRFAKNER